MYTRYLNPLNVVFCLLMFLSSCGFFGKKDNTNSIIEVLVIQEVKEKEFSDYFKLSSVINLETNENSYITDIRKIFINDNGIFILDGFKQVLHFDRTGKYIKQFNSIGKGPGEWVEIFDFDMDDTNIIIRSQHKELTYSINGEFIEEVPNKNSAQEFVRIDNKTKAYYCSQGFNNSHNVLIKKESKKENYHIKTIGALKGYEFKSRYSRIFCQTQMGFIFVKAFNDTIYQLNSTFPFSPKYRIDFGAKRYPVEKLKDANLVDKFDREYANYISNVYETEVILYFEYVEGLRPKRVIFDKTIGKVILNENIRHDKENMVPIRIVNYYGNVNNALSILEPSEYFEFRELFSIDSEDTILPELKGINEADNPILLFYSINDN